MQGTCPSMDHVPSKRPHKVQARCVGKRVAVFGPGRGCFGLAAATPGDVILGSIAEDVLPPVW
ncbi:hypothetical protein EYF80_018202 [Liparis tanakae]|uniref:Uncharacterized protein n=1 Tax=Liparis tanakae TaxID=230148 RepID=A0A4Z2I0F1_9TELE|nr:hypothetical protein EYF80_018202 [Liparis tanakae]